MTSVLTSPPKRIGVITTTRAEWYLLEPVAHALARDARCDTVIFAGGAHLMAAHGHTIDVVEAKAPCRVRRVDFTSGTEPGDDSVAMAMMMGRAVCAFAEVLADEKPDIVVVLGDRFEIMSAALAAVSLRIPVAHIEGGHVTEGALDERFRHAISKLADIHYVALPVHRQRIVSLGEDSARIIVTGPIGATQASLVAPLSRQEMRALSGFDPALHPIFIATVHSETASGTSAETMAVTFCEAVARVLEGEPRPCFLFTAANLDPGGQTINAALQALASRCPDRVRFVASIGRDYLRALRTVAGVVGNSSSGILESAALGVPTLNIGSRQQGRDRYGTVTELDWDAGRIAAVISEYARRWSEHSGAARPVVTAERGLPWDIIAEHLATVETDALKIKPFVQVPA